MKTFKTILTLALASLLMQACSDDGEVNNTITQSIPPTSGPEAMQLAKYMGNFRKASAYSGINSFSIENTLGDEADGDPTTRVEVHETRFGDLSEVFVIIIGETTEARSYITQANQGDLKLFVKGPSPDLDIEDDKWHVTADQAIINDRLNALPTRVLQEMLSNPDQLEPAFGQPEATKHAEKNCKAYRAPADKLPEQTTAGLKRLFSRVDAIEFTATLCEDGLPHMLMVTGAGMGTTDPSKPAKVEIKLEFESFGNVRPVELPTEVLPLEIKPTANAEMEASDGNAIATEAAPVPEATPAKVAEGPTVLGQPFANMNDGSYGSEEPMIGLVTDKLPVRFDAEKEALNYISKIPLKELFGYYQNYYRTERGLIEREFVTSVFENGFSIVFDGLPDGRAIVVQATRIEAERTNVNISKRKE